MYLYLEKHVPKSYCTGLNKMVQITDIIIADSILSLYFVFMNVSIRLSTLTLTTYVHSPTDAVVTFLNL